MIVERAPDWSWIRVECRECGYRESRFFALHEVLLLTRRHWWGAFARESLVQQAHIRAELVGRLRGLGCPHVEGAVAPDTQPRVWTLAR